MNLSTAVWYVSPLGNNRSVTRERTVVSPSQGIPGSLRGVSESIRGITGNSGGTGGSLGRSQWRLRKSLGVPGGFMGGFKGSLGRSRGSQAVSGYLEVSRAFWWGAQRVSEDFRQVLDRFCFRCFWRVSGTLHGVRGVLEVFQKDFWWVCYSCFFGGFRVSQVCYMGTEGVLGRFREHFRKIQSILGGFERRYS